MMLTKKYLYGFTIVAILLSGSAHLGAHEGHAPLPTKGVQVDIEKGLITLSPEAYQSLGLQTAAVEERAMEVEALAYATLVTPWKQQYYVSSQLSGRIASLHVGTGEAVKPGQLLAEVASPELDALQLELRTAANELNLSARQAERLRDLAQSQAVRERDYLEAKAKYEQDKNAVHIARNKLLSLGINEAAIDKVLNGNGNDTLLVAPLFSPIAGSVSHTDLALGKTITANEHLFEVNDLSTLWVKIGVLERDVARIRPGQTVELAFSAFPRKVITTTITIAPVEVDPVTHVATAWAEISNSSNSSQYLPGMYGTASIVTSEPTELLSVPASSLLGNGAERYVLVEVAATAKSYEYRRQNVVVAAQNATFAQLRPGALFPGDRVVKTGGQVLSSFFILGSLRLSSEGIRNVGLQVEAVQKHVVEDVLTVEGVIDLPSGRVANVTSQLIGSLSKVHVERGMPVSAGQILAEVASLSLQDTQLEMLKADLDAKLSAGTLERLKSIGPLPLVAERRIWETESERNAAVNRRDSARQTLITIGMTAEEVDQILNTGQTLAALPIRSPISGVIVGFDKVLGEGVTPDETIVDVHDLSHPWAQAFLSESDAPRVQIGMPARIRLLSDPTFVGEGKVVRSARMVGTESRTLAVWIDFTSLTQQTLQRNLLARMSITLGQPEATLAVPLSAIVHEQNRSYVFVQQAEGLLERRRVELGRSDDRFVEVPRGLQIGEQIAVQGTAELQTTFASVR